MSEFPMPSLGADMEGGTVVEWLKQPGDEVHHGEIIAVVETDKGAIEIEVFEDGILKDIAAAVGEYRDVGDVIAQIEGVAGAGVTSSESVAVGGSDTSTPRRIRVSPAARRRAKDLDVDLDIVSGTGVAGAITISDVERTAGATGQGAEAEAKLENRAAGIDLVRMRSAIGAAMTRSKREIPHYYVSATIDVTRMTSWLATFNEEVPVAERILPAVPLIKAVARALDQVPQINGTWADDAFQASKEINIGVVIALRGGGLVAPAILNTNELSVAELMAKLRDLSGRVRQGHMRGSELTGSTFTISNVGEGNVEAILPIIYPPQVAILGIGSINVRPWVVDGEVRRRQLITATLAGDHRASDGRIGARFLGALDKLLQEPEAL